MGIWEDFHSEYCRSEAAGRGICFLYSLKSRIFASIALMLLSLAAPAAAAAR
jgi:hypothetical protein